MDNRQNIIDLYRMSCVCVLTEIKVEQGKLEWCLWTSNKVRYMHSMVDAVQKNYTGLKLWRFLKDPGDSEPFWQWLDEQRIAYENVETYAHADYKYKLEPDLKYAILNPNTITKARIYFNMRSIGVLRLLQRINSPYIVPYLSGIFVYSSSLDKKLFNEIDRLVKESYSIYGGVER